jgi:hypothetical protein
VRPKLQFHLGKAVCSPLTELWTGEIQREALDFALLKTSLEILQSCLALTSCPQLRVKFLSKLDFKCAYLHVSPIIINSLRALEVAHKIFPD